MAIGRWISFTAQAVSPTPDTHPPKPVPIRCTADGKQFGLENFGNTCYANSVLQALYFCSPFRDLILQHADPYAAIHASSHFSPTNPPSSPAATRRKPDRKSTQDSPPITVPHPPAPPITSASRALFSALRALYVHISQNPADKGTVAPRAFIQKLREVNEAFRNTMHQDAHEFLNYLLNRIVEEIEEEKRIRLASGDDLPRSTNSSSTASHTPAMTASASSSSTPLHSATFIHRIFEGTLTSETRCLTCENVSSRDESFLDLSIDIEQNSSVSACLRQFSASEMLCQKDKFFCDACCDLQEAERRMKIKRLPNVLALHLKRFKYQEDVQKYIKLTYRVAFPFELRLFNTVDDIPNPDRLYELFAIVVHIGNGPNHGHYVSIIRTRGAWFVFDDDNVDSIKECDIPKYFGDSNSGSAYVLFYQALDIDLPGIGLRSSSPVPEPVTVPPSEPPRAWQPADSPVFTAQSIPPLPPGLTEDLPSPPLVPEAAPPRPMTPPRAPTTPEPKSPRKVSSQFFKAALGRPATVGHGSSPRNETLLRSSRSVLVGPVSKPNLPPITVFPKEDHKPVESNGNAAVAVNGKESHSDKSMMGWLRRRSFKSVKARPASDVNTDRPPLPQDVLAAPGSPVRNQSTCSSSNSSKDSRRPLDSPTPGHSSPRMSTSPLPNGKSPPLSREPPDTSSHEMDSRSPSVSPGPYTSPLSPSSLQRPLPSIPASPQTLNTDMPPFSGFSRKSLEQNNARRRPAISTMNDASQSSPTKSSGRPSTSTGTPTKDHSPLSSAPANHRPHPNHTLRVPTANIATGRLDVHDPVVAAVERPKSAHATYGVVLAPPPTPPVPVPMSAGGAGGAPTRRRTVRKLSLTAPMLGFGKRDKEKQ